MSATASSHASLPLYSFSCLPFLSYTEGIPQPQYRFAYTRSTEAPPLSKETVWRVVSTFKDYLKGGQNAFCLLRTANLWTSTRRHTRPNDAPVLTSWKSWMSRHAAASNMTGQRLILDATADGPGLLFDFTLHDKASRFDKPPASGKVRTETWRFYQIQAPWSPVLITSLPLALVPGDQTPRPHFDVQSQFYAPRNKVGSYRDALVDATRDSPAMREHIRHCRPCALSRSHVICELAQDELASTFGWSVERDTIAVPEWVASSIGTTRCLRIGVDQVVGRLRRSHESLRPLTYDVYDSKDTYNAGLDWMGLSIDELPLHTP